MDMSPQLRDQLDAEHARYIERDAMNGDRENDHRTADDALCDLLLELGCVKTVEAWKKVGKWYA